MHTPIHMYVYMHLYICIYIVCVRVCVHMCARVRLCVCWRFIDDVRTRLLVCSAWLLNTLGTCKCMHKYVCIYMYICVNAYIYVYICVNIYNMNI